MKRSKAIVLCASFLILILLIGVGVVIFKEINKEAEIKKSFQKTLGMYPIKNLDDLYDKEGYRDEEFEKGDKGTWLLHSEMSIQSNGGDLISKGMVLEINRNTRTAKGDYITKRITEDSKGKTHNIKKKYPIKMESNKIIPIEKIENSKIKKEIADFKFFAQYADFKELDKYKGGDIDYNPNVPSYSAEYDLENSDYNVKQLRKQYDIPTKKRQSYC